jgi:deoxyribonuclease-4
MAQPLLGAHESVAGGMAEGIRRARELDCESLQVFVKNSNQWKARPFTPAEIEAYRAAHAASGIGPVVAHAGYLINLAAPEGENREKSRAGLADELGRCDRLGIVGLVVHPGAHLGRGIDEGIATVVESIDGVYGAPDAPRTPTLLELTAGAGTHLGSKLEELAAIRSASRFPASIGFCLDTCHAFAGGYPIHEASGWSRFLADVDRILGLDRVACWHLNDSVGALGSHKDRHAPIGEGELGRGAFARLVNDPAVAGVPLLLETPLGDDERGHARDLETLRGLLRAPAARQR